MFSLPKFRMAPSTTSVPNTLNGSVQNDSEVSGASEAGYAQPHLLGLMEVAGILRVQPELVVQLTQENSHVLSDTAQGIPPQYTHADLAALINGQHDDELPAHVIPSNPEQGYTEQGPEKGEPASAANTTSSHLEAEQAAPESVAQSHQTLNSETGYVPSRFDEFRPSQKLEASNGLVNNTDHSETPLMGVEPHDATTSTDVQTDHAPTEPAPLAQTTPLPAEHMLGEMLSTVATSQQSVLNVQDSIREMLNVIAQDNFNLKHENRKLRERMLELERVIAEHQRREETRKEMLESRMRAVEGTLSALQQQLAQLVQLQRQRIRNKHWFR